MGMGTSIFITVGILTGQVIGLKELLGKEEHWPILLSTTCIPAFLQLLILPWFPENPHYRTRFLIYSHRRGSTSEDASPVFPYVSMVCVFAFILSFGLGPGGVTNILTTELFTQTARPAAYIIAGSLNWLSFFFIGLVFPFIVVGVQKIGLQQYCFLVFLAICSLMAIYIFFFVPETKNKTFMEIQNEFQSRKACSPDEAGTTLLSTSI
ncbi:solute carrier family 2, facilitated glucose transporter member 9-like [Sander vitreus]